MYLVGHAIVAFLLAYGISRKFKIAGLSFALVMLVACVPDIDILFESIGVGSHKTYTHSLILSILIVPPLAVAIAKWRRLPAITAFVYSLAYIQHIIIGDVAVGGINILWPFGNFLLGSGIGYGTVPHQLLEFAILGAAAGIILSKAFTMRLGGDPRTGSAQLFRFSQADKVSYALILVSLTISFVYLVYGIKVLPRFFVETNLELALFVMLHLSAMALISFMIVVARTRKNLETITEKR